MGVRKLVGRTRTYIVPAALLALSACSGSGSGSSPTPAPAPTPTPTPPAANQPPAFTSAATASVAENVAAAYQATASDADGNPLSFAVAGGADAARFTITTAGALRFVTAPSFESPADADGDNVYAVQLSVTDGTATATQNLQVTVTDSREGIQVRRVATGLSSPLYLTGIPGDTRVVIVERGGALIQLDPATGTRTTFATIGNLSTSGERGALGLAFATDYQTSGVFYVFATNPTGDIEIRAYRRAAGGAVTLVRVMLTIPHRDFDNHNGGWLGFGPDGNLYIGTGDGGGGGDPGNNAQNVNSLLGKILRITVPADPAQPYTIPSGNPFAGGGGAPEIFAYGFRNPFRASFSPAGLIVGDVGQGAIEEVDLLRPQDTGNYGWRFLEGTQPFSGTAPAGLIPPVLQYGHGTGPKQGNSITGGYVYRGPVTSLLGSYVFGDFVRGAIWTAPASAFQQGQTLGDAAFERRNLDFTPDQGTINQLASFGEDNAGNLYIVDFDGEIFVVAAAP